MRGETAIDWADCVVRWCIPLDSIGADGVVVLEESDSEDVKMRIFNSDGSEAEMCGRGFPRPDFFSEFLKYAEAAIAKQGGRQIFVETSLTEPYGKARSFYVKHGYGVASVYEDFYGIGDNKITFKRKSQPVRGSLSAWDRRYMIQQSRGAGTGDEKEIKHVSSKIARSVIKYC
jgi:hypothetical protein